MSETPAVYGQTQSRRRFAKSDDNGSSPPRARAEHKKYGRSGGGIRIALWAAGKSL